MKKINKILLCSLPFVGIIISMPIVITGCSSNDVNGEIIPYNKYKSELTETGYKSYFFVCNWYSSEIKNKNNDEMFNFLEIKREDVGKQWRNIKKFKEIIYSHFFYEHYW